MDLDNIQRKYGLPAPLPVVQNGKFAPRFPLNLEHRGDDVFQFGGKYIGEIENIYDLLYKILTNQEIDASLALPYAIKITEDKLYIRDKTNSEWILIFDITKPNFPKEIELYELIYKAITHQVIGEDTSYPGQFKIEENILYVRDKDNLTWTQIGDVTKEFLGATEATQAILDQVNEVLTEVQELKTELNRQIATTNETLTTALQAANEAMTSAQSINIRTFNSVEEVKASNTLKVGALVKTQGFYVAGDGGGTDYLITNNTDEVDEVNTISLQNGLYAKNLTNKETNKNINSINNNVNMNNYLGIGEAALGNWSAGIYKEHGFYTFRSDLLWSSVEVTKGKYDASYYLERMTIAKNAGMDAVWILGKNNTLYGDGNVFDDMVMQEGFINYVKYTVNAFKEAGFTGLTWETYNEPSNEILASNNYINLMKKLYTAIKEIDETAKILSPGGCGSDIYTIDSFATACKNGLLKYTDIVSIHPYLYQYDNIDGLIEIFSKFKAIVKQYSVKNIDFYITEIGFSTVADSQENGRIVFCSEEIRAKIFPCACLLALSLGVKKCIIFTSTTREEDTTNKEDWFGIFGGALVEKPTSLAFKNLFNIVKDTCFIETYYKTDSATILKFMRKNTGEYIFVGWSNTTEKILIGNNSYELTDTFKLIDIKDYKSLKTYNSNIFLEKGDNVIFNDVSLNRVEGNYSSVFGYKNIVMGDYNIASGNTNILSGNNNAISGELNVNNGDSSIISGNINHNIGNNNTVNGNFNITSGNDLFVGGINNVLTTLNSDVYTIASGGVNTINLNSIDGLNVNDYVAVVGDYVSSFCVQIIKISGNTITVTSSKYGNIDYNGKIYSKVIKLQGANKNTGFVTGNKNILTGVNGFVAGSYNYIKNDLVSCFGYNNLGGNYAQLITGKWCKSSANVDTETTINGDAFVIGNGTAWNTRSNAFRVTYAGQVYGQSAFNSTGADYAEYFEWVDGNTENEDRTGYFVTLEGDKIKKATNDSEYILGVVSVNPSVIGNSYNDQWQGMYERDDWGRIKYEEFVIEETLDREGNTIPKHVEKMPMLNKNYDSSKEYMPREKRKEWCTVGMLGVLLVRDDGSCVVNGYCKSNASGIAIKSDTGYRVIGRVSENIIKIIFK